MTFSPMHAKLITEKINTNVRLSIRRRAMQYLEPINETSYLSVPNAPVYRKIMRCFYREYEKMNFQLYKEEILELLKKDEQFADYTMEQLLVDLDALVK